LCKKRNLVSGERAKRARRSEEEEKEVPYTSSSEKDPGPSEEHNHPTGTIIINLNIYPTTQLGEEEGALSASESGGDGNMVVPAASAEDLDNGDLPDEEEEATGEHDEEAGQLALAITMSLEQDEISTPVEESNIVGFLNKQYFDRLTRTFTAHGVCYDHHAHYP
jgi:hypothetical protein